MTISMLNSHVDSYILFHGESLPEDYVEYGTTLNGAQYANKSEVESEISSVESEISSVESEISSVESEFKDNVLISSNIFNKDDVILNHYYAGDATTPTLSSQNNSYACALVELPHDNTNYIVNYRDLQFDIYDADKNRIRQAYVTAGTPFTVPKEAKYLTVSLLKTHIADFMLVEGDSLPSEYVEFGTSLKNGVYVSTPKEYHVGIKYTGEEYYDSASLTALLKELKDDNSEKVIYIHGGTYDIFSEYGGADYISTLTGSETWDEVSVFVPNNTKIIGIGDVVLNFKPSASEIQSDTFANLFSALNVSENASIENITINGMNCRYCVHDEINDNSAGTTHKYKNVRMHKIQDTYGNVQAFGCGFTDAMKYEFDNCEFTSWSIPFSMHNNDTTSSLNGATINIRHCYFQSEISSVSISLRDNSKIQTEHIVNIYDSFVGGQWANLELTAGTNTENVNCFNVTMIGCNYVRTQVIVTPTNIYPIKQYNSIVTATVTEKRNSNILSMFSKIICCGDSLTYGLVYTSATTYRQAKVPYNEALQKITGVTTERIATAGYTSKDWWDNNNSHLNEDALYIVFLGTNGGLTDTISTDCVGTDPSAFADTNTGCYGKILQTLANNGKTAVLIEPPAANDTTKAVIDSFSSRFSFPTITLDGMESAYYHYAPHNTSYSNTIHYNDLGYVHLANCINYAVNNFGEGALFNIAPYVS